ncbi:hypothetical protein BDL97_01G064800 [Sphagnum fallax]|nr:hypothetical protein BDL97_01G064800 [Sphagnum fallax]
MAKKPGAPPVVVPNSCESAQQRADLVRVQLLVQKSTKRVLYMEAGKDFVDMLFSFLMLPTGAVIKLISQGLNEWPVGAISNIFKSVDNLNASFMNIGCKDILLSPQPAWGYRASSLLRIQGAESEPTTYYICSNFCKRPGSRTFMTRNLGDLCPKCKYPITSALTESQEPLSTELESKPAGAGYVKENTTYMITDDMEIYPTSTIKSIVLLNKLKVENMSDLDSLEITVGVTQAFQLLRASLTTSSALNDVFAKEVCKYVSEKGGSKGGSKKSTCGSSKQSVVSGKQLDDTSDDSS